MSYVVIEDVAASWEDYRPFADALAGPTPAGLIVHAAGRTDEGFRIVGLWESEDAWRRFAESVDRAGRRPPPRQALRALQSEHVVYGRPAEQPWSPLHGAAQS